MSYLPINPRSNQALWQASGIGAFEQVGDWSWMFYPGAFSWLAPRDSAIQPAIPSTGLGGCGCGGKCGGCGGGHDHSHGLGQGLFNTGCFASTDMSTWGWCEWGLLAAGAYFAVSFVGDLIGAGRSVKSSYRSYRKSAQRRAQAQAAMF